MRGRGDQSIQLVVIAQPRRRYLRAQALYLLRGVVKVVKQVLGAAQTGHDVQIATEVGVANGGVPSPASDGALGGGQDPLPERIGRVELHRDLRYRASRCTVEPSRPVIVIMFPGSPQERGDVPGPEIAVPSGVGIGIIVRRAGQEPAVVEQVVDRCVRGELGEERVEGPPVDPVAPLMRLEHDHRTFQIARPPGVPIVLQFGPVGVGEPAIVSHLTARDLSKRRQIAALTAKA